MRGRSGVKTVAPAQLGQLLNRIPKAQQLGATFSLPTPCRGSVSMMPTTAAFCSTNPQSGLRRWRGSGFLIGCDRFMELRRAIC